MDTATLVVLIVLGIGILTSLFINSRTQARLDGLSGRIPDIEVFNTLQKRLQEVDEGSRKSFERLASDLGKLSKATDQMMEVGKSISGLEDLLKPPKLRGGMGELLLGELLAQILPGNYELQHSFSTGAIVDAVITLGDSYVPVDSKFPLESFRRIFEADDEDSAKKERKGFIKAVKKHIDDIASKYILPDEGTFDFALMYIPAENVYYETILKDEDDKGLFPYAMEKKVIPVSPNSFYAYLQVIIRGLKGMRIEERALEIMNYLGRLQGDQEKFRNDFDILGKHLENARNKYTEADKRLGRFEDKLLVAGDPTNLISSVEEENLPSPSD